MNIGPIWARTVEEAQILIKDLMAIQSVTTATKIWVDSVTDELGRTPNSLSDALISWGLKFNEYPMMWLVLDGAEQKPVSFQEQSESKLQRWTFISPVIF